MSQTVSVAFVVEKEYQNPGGIAEIESILKSLGALSTTSGYATVSGQFTPAQIEKHFSVHVETVPPIESEEQDFGARGGYVTDAKPRIPTSLGGYVTSVSIEPPVTRHSE